VTSFSMKKCLTIIFSIISLLSLDMQCRALSLVPRQKAWKLQEILQQIINSEQNGIPLAIDKIYQRSHVKTFHFGVKRARLELQWYQPVISVHLGSSGRVSLRVTYQIKKTLFGIYVPSYSVFCVLGGGINLGNYA
jgi:hypothetical protein